MDITNATNDPIDATASRSRWQGPRRLVAVGAFALASVAGVAACADDDDTTPTDPGNTQPTTDPGNGTGDLDDPVMPDDGTEGDGMDGMDGDMDGDDPTQPTPTP